MDSNRRKKMGQNSFTEDLIIEIISRVPTKHLLRFSCVSKSWRSLICTDLYFSRLQHARTASLDRPCLIIQELKPSYNYWIDLESVEVQSINLREIHHPFMINNPSLNAYAARVLASCHDLLVQESHPCPNMIAVSNPITRKHVILPPSPEGNWKVVFYGFGYDRVHDRYKLITRVKHHPDHSLDLMVYDLDKGTWRRLQFGMWWQSQFQDTRAHLNLYCYWDLCHAKCVDGALYWCLSMETGMMVCFLLAEEEFHMVNPPDLGLVTKYYPDSMTIFDGKLCLVCQGLNTSYEFWTIDMDRDDDGKRQWRWTKLLAISDLPPYFRQDIVPPYLELDSVLIPVCFSACKNKILILSSIDYQLFWYDMVKKEFNKLLNPIHGRCQEGQLFWYDMVERKVHKLNNPVDGRTSTWIKML